MITKNDVVTVADRSGEATGKPRPAIIVTSDVFATLDWIVICPLTTQPPEPDSILMREVVRLNHEAGRLPDNAALAAIATIEARVAELGAQLRDRAAATAAADAQIK